MKILLTAFILIAGLSLIGCSGKNQASPEIKVKQEENQPATKTPQPDNYTGMENNTIQPSASPTASNIEKDKVILDIPLIKQNPELKYGCEVTSLAMVLKHAGIKTDKLRLADELPKDNDPVKKTESGDITRWGNPDHGFVGDVTGKRAGYAVYVGPLEQLVNRYLNNRTVNLTGKPFDKVLEQIKKERPVILWTTGDYKAPDRWESWKHGNEKINTPLDLHAVVLVGFDKEHLYINDPLSGKKAHKIKKDSFLESWKALGRQALSYD